MSFDEIIDRRGTHCMKWDMMEQLYGVPAEGGIAMWVADMEFRPPARVTAAVQAMVDHGIYGYFGDETDYRAAIAWWMRERHGWEIDPGWIFSTHGLVNGTALCVDTWTAPGDAVVLFTPVYHAFARVIRAAGREVRELPLAIRDGRYEMDFDAYGSLMKGNERMAILCSPHNPGGRVWTRKELCALADFCAGHDLIPTPPCARPSAGGSRRSASRPIPSDCSWPRRPIRPRARPGWTNSCAISTPTGASSTKG